MNKMLLFLGIAVFIILASGCIQVGKEGKAAPKEAEGIGAGNESIANETIEEITIGPCSGFKIEEVDLCLLNNSLCDDIVSVELQDQCYYNTMNCSQILNETLKSECETKLKLIECESKDNINLCKAVATGDAVYCGSNADCMLEYSFQKGDAAGCSKLKSYEITACRAVAAPNYELCYEEQYEASQKECLKLYASLTGADGDICSKIEIRDYRENCYKGVAEGSGDYSNCLLIDTYNIHKNCLQNVAIENADASICDNIRQFYSAEQKRNDISFCKTQTAQINYKPQICQEIDDAAYKWGCFGGSISEGKVKKEDCDLIDESMYPEWSAECYKRAIK